MMISPSCNADDKRQAPLASLDCSITEPNSSPCHTPTLSGYFDCDQLSDMVDDSLFVITAPTSLLHNASPSTPVQLPRHQPNDTGYDYSSTSRVPALARASASGTPSSAGQTSERNRPRSARISAGPSNSANQEDWRDKRRPTSAKTRSKSHQNFLDQNSQVVVDKQLKQMGAHTNRTSKQETPNEQQQQHQQQPLCSDCASKDELQANHKTRKRRFTFGFFDLFIGRQDEPATCEHVTSSVCNHDKRNPTIAQNLHRSHGRNNKNCVKSRDSIRLMNQRKQQQRQIHQSNSYSNDLALSARLPNKDAINSSEVLLDLSHNRTTDKTSEPDASNQQELLVQQPNIDQAIGQAHKHPISALTSSSASMTFPTQGLDHKQTQRQVHKSVKFHMPDRIMVFPSGDQRDSSSRLLLRSLNLTNQQQDQPTSWHLPPPAGSQPIAPIIKRSPSSGLGQQISNEIASSGSADRARTQRVRTEASSRSPATATTTIDLETERLEPVKRSSFAQTDHSDSLDKLLARYEANSQLVRDISLKLQLTETIDCPRSALDQTFSQHRNLNQPEPPSLSSQQEPLAVNELIQSPTL